MLKRFGALAAMLLAGIAIGPLLICAVAGVSPTAQRYHARNFGPDIVEGMALLDAYRAAFPDDVTISPPIRRPEDSDRNCPITATLTDPMADPVVSALAEGGAKDRQDYGVIAVLEVGRTSTGFGRRFLTACLTVPIYREACRASASGILKEGVKEAAYQMGEIRSNYRKATCEYLVGKATMSGSTGRTVSTP